MCFYSDDNNAAIDWARWTAGGGWVIQGDVAVAGKGFTESVQIESFTTQNKLMAIFTDTNSDLYAYTYDGTTWTATNGGAALELTVSSIASKPFGFDIKE